MSEHLIAGQDQPTQPQTTSASAPPKTYAVGELDHNGNKVVRILANSEGRYFVYETETGSVEVDPGPIKLAADPKLSVLLAEIGDLAIAAPTLTRRFNPHRAFAVKLWLDGDVQGAVAAAKKTYSALFSAIGRRSRLWFLSGAGIGSAIAVLVFGLYQSFASADSAVKPWVAVALLGSLGAFSSIATRRETPVDLLEDRRYILSYGLVRSLVGTIFSLVAYIAVLAGWIMAEGGNETIWPMLALAFAAGFSEKLVPETVLGRARKTVEAAPGAGK